MTPLETVKFSSRVMPSAKAPYQLVKEVAAFGGDVSKLVPPYVLDRLVTRLAEQA